MLEFRLIEETDIPVVNALAGKIWREHYPGIITHAQIEHMLELWYSEEALRKHLAEGYLYTLAVLNGEPVGYIAITKQKEPGQYFVARFYVDRAQKGKGVGRALFDHAVKQLPDAQAMTLRVNRRNIHPINSYFRMGFRILKADTLDIGHGYLMEDFVMGLDVKERQHVQPRAA